MLVSRQTVMVMDHLGDNGVTMVIMLMVLANIVARRRRAAAVDMHGRVMEQQRDLFTALREALLRGHLAQSIDREVVTVVIVVVAVVGTVTVSLLRPSLLSRRPPRRWLLPDRCRSCPVRLWTR